MRSVHGGVLLGEPEQTQLLVPRGGLILPGFGRLFAIADGEMEYDAKGKPIVAGAAFASGIYVDNMIDVFDATQLVIDLSLTTHKWALYTDTLTPDFSAASAAYSSTNEVSGTGYTATGRTIATGGGSPTVTESPATVMMYDQNDMVWPAPCSFTARGGIMYADAITTPFADPLVVASNFGVDITATNGSFTIQFNSLGVLTVDWA
jgi:hypothetical protein